MRSRLPRVELELIGKHEPKRLQDHELLTPNSITPNPKYRLTGALTSKSQSLLRPRWSSA